MTYLKVTPHDPIVARDGRPFGAGSGSRMKGLGWPTPSVMAGSLRTMLGKEEPDGFINSVVTKLKSMEVAGPLPLWNGDLFFPAPKDFALRPCNAASGTPRACFRLRPRSLAEGEYCDLPGEVPRPVLLPDEAGEEFKPEPPPAFWSSGKMAAWLGESEFPPPPESRKREPAGGFPDATEKDERTHVQIAPERGAAAEHLLFSTISLAFPEGLSMALRVSGLDGTFAGGFHPAGGERRLAYWETAERAPWLCPSALAVKLRDAPLIRMVLARMEAGLDCREPGRVPSGNRREAAAGGCDRGPLDCRLRLRPGGGNRGAETGAAHGPRRQRLLFRVRGRRPRGVVRKRMAGTG